MKAFRTVFAVVSAAALMCFTGCGDSDNNDDTPAPEVLNLAGVWTVTITYTADSNVETWTYNLTQTGSTLSGTSYESNRPAETATMSGTVNGTAVTLTEDWGPDGIYTYTGTASSATSMTGTCQYARGKEAATWTAVKQ